MIKSDAELKIGDDLIWWSGEFAGQLQRAFTWRGKRWYDDNKRDGKISHNSVIKKIENNKVYDLDVNWKVRESQVTIKTNAGLRIYRPDVPKDVMEEALNDLWNRFAGKQYPWWQWQTYPSRWLFEIFYQHKYLYYGLLFPYIWHLLHQYKDPRQWGTLFPELDVCSEACKHHLYTWYICPKMSAKGDKRFDRLYNRLKEWSSNKFHSTDSLVVNEDFPDIFELIFEKQLGA